MSPECAEDQSGSWTSRSVVIKGAGELEIIASDVPAPRATEVLVKMHTVAICGSDVSYFVRGASGSSVLNGPMVLGHEGSGIVHAVGSSVSSIDVGDRVAINPSWPCRECEQCASGLWNLCPNMQYGGSAARSPHTDGLMSEMVTVDQWQCIRLPGRLDISDAALVEPAAVALHAIERAPVEPGDEVLVVGAGAIGLLTMAAAEAAGARSIDVIEPDLMRRSRAASRGARSCFGNHEAATSRYSVIIESSGTPAGLSAALHLAAPGGSIVQVGGLPAGGITAPLGQIMAKELRVSGSFRFRDEMHRVCAMVDEGIMDLSGIIDKRIAFTHAHEALQLASSGTSVKVALTFEEVE